MTRLRKRHALAGLLLLLCGVAVHRWVQEGAPRAADAASVSAPSAGGVAMPRFVDDDGAAFAWEARSDEARARLAALLEERLNGRLVRPAEAVLTFQNEAAYRRFFGRAAQSGAIVLGRIDSLFAVRVQVADYAAFVRELTGNTSDYVAIAANATVAPPMPPPEERELRPGVAVGRDLLGVLGVAGEHPEWGRGVTIAVLDGGAAPDPTLGTRLRYLDVGYGVTGLAEDTRHGTAVAAVAAGAMADARGVAPAAQVLSIRVTDAAGKSDAFAVAQGIVAAVDAGAQVINISMGGYATSSVLGEAVDYALAAGAAVVAAAGNDQAARLVWPAAYAGVVSVGAVDALGWQAGFSNSGETLQLSAPGLGIQTAASNGERFLFSGTSASAPVVSGAIAALMSQTAGLGAIQAADVLATYANDNGVAGADADYGRGTLNLGWAMDRANAARRDVAIASQAYAGDSGQFSVVVQNRGGQPQAGLTLVVEIGGERSVHALAPLAVAASVTVTVPVNLARLAAQRQLVARAEVLLADGQIDQNPANNVRSALIEAR